MNPVIAATILWLLIPAPTPEPMAQEEPPPVSTRKILETLGSGLTDADRGVRFAAVQAMEKSGDATVMEDLERMLRDPEWCVRMQAAHALRSFGPRSLPIFQRALDRTNPDGMRHAAAVSLARLGEIGKAHLRTALADPNERVRFVAAHALADERAVAVLRELLGAKDPVLGIEAAQLITGLGHGKDAVKTLLAGVRSYLGVPRYEVAGMLKKTGACGPAEASALVEILLATKESEFHFRHAIVDVLAAIGEPALDAIRAGLAKNPEVGRQMSLNAALTRISPKNPQDDQPDTTPGSGEKENNEDLLARLTAPGTSRADRLIAAEHLAARPGARENLLGLLTNPTAAEFALDALLAMEGGVPSNEREARALLSSPAPPMRRLGIRALRRLTANTAIPPLLEDPDPAVRSTARWALSAPTSLPRPARPLRSVNDLIALLSSPDLAASLFAADDLPRHGSACAAPLARAMASGHYGVLHHAEWIFMQLGANGAPATGQLIGLLDHEDVNLREVAARCLGEIGPAARPAVPALVRLLRAPRIAVRARAAVALGRIGEAAVGALLSAAKHDDARVRAGACFALGWILGDRAGRLQVATDIRLPVAEPGPAKETGFVPTGAQLARARTLATAQNLKECRARLAGLDPEASVAVLRAGLRLSEVRAAVNCAAMLSMEDIDAWEAERCVELLLPEIFSPDPQAPFWRVYEYLGSAEVAATIGYLALAGLSDRERSDVFGDCHRLVRWDLIPEVHRLERSNDAWVIADNGDVWMPRDWSDRYRERADSGKPGTDRLPGPLRRAMERGPGFPPHVRAWLNDSIPGEADAPLLLSLARSVHAAPEDEIRCHDLTALMRALGHVHDRPSERFLLSWFAATGPEGHFARSALARRHDPDALRRLCEDAREGWLPLSLLMEVRPEIGVAAFRRQLIHGNEYAPCWDLAGDFSEVRWFGTRWASGLFNGMEPAVLAAEPGPQRLSCIALMVPGFRTRKVAETILAGLPAVAGELVAEQDHDEDQPRPEPAWPDVTRLFAFLHAADPGGVTALLRGWTTHETPAVRHLALRFLASIGDPASAPALLRYIHTCRGKKRPDWLPLPLARSATPEVVSFLHEVVSDDKADADERNAACRELAMLHGLPDREAWPSSLEATSAEFTALVGEILAGRPAQGLVNFCRGRDDSARVPIDLLGALTGSAAARTYLRELSTRRISFSYPTVLGQLARLGDVPARREFWSGVRAGRYRWICYENEYAALTMGRDPSTYPALLSETESNCCRGGHVARMFEELMGDDALGFEPRGQDATPVRNARAWLRLFHGRWKQSPVCDRYGCRIWIPDPR